MIKLVLVLATMAALDTAASAIQTDTAPVATATPVPVVDIANDPRMLAAIRHANARADAKCGVGAGVGNVDLQTKMAARTCRRRMVDAAKLETESEIAGK